MMNADIIIIIIIIYVMYRSELALSSVARC